MKTDEELVEEKSHNVLLWRRVSAILSKERLSGDFLPKHEQPFLAEISRRISLFVCFECDSLNEEVGEKKRVGTLKTSSTFLSVKGRLACSSLC